MSSEALLYKVLTEHLGDRCVDGKLVRSMDMAEMNWHLIILSFSDDWCSSIVCR
jgi:hypothetical protein